MSGNEQSTFQGISLSRISVIAGSALAIVVIAVALFSAPTLMRVKDMTATQSINAPRASEQQALAMTAEHMSKYGQAAIEAQNAEARASALASFGKNASLIMSSDVIEDKTIVKAAMQAMAVASSKTQEKDALIAKQQEIVARMPKLVNDFAITLAPILDEDLSSDTGALIGGQAMLLALNKAQSVIALVPHADNPKWVKRHFISFRGAYNLVNQAAERLSDTTEDLSALPGQIEEMKSLEAIFKLRDQIIVKQIEANEATQEAQAKLTETVTNLVASATAASQQIIDDTRRVEEETNFLMTVLSLGAVAILVALSIFGVMTQINILRPLRAYSSQLRELIAGNITSEAMQISSKITEFNDIGIAADSLREAMVNREEAAAREEERERLAKEERRQTREQMANNFEQAVGGVVAALTDAATDMQSAAEALSITAEQASEQSSTVAMASEQASANVQTVASASEELTASISEISRQVLQSTEVAGSAVTEVDSANSKVQGLAEAANKIGEVVALITDIADQTNLLALNATIEAARAGDAGKGFAVVASEVKNLANQTAKATEEISAQIGGIQGATEEAVQAIGSIGNTINQINGITSTVAAAVEEQGAATQEISRNVDEASHGTQEVSQNIDRVSTAATETGQSAEQLLDAAKNVAQQSVLLNFEVNKLLTEFRS
ncbi:MAG: methyl-accepting chemotaxis protein [Magnetovibrio sp.]|nr:methyl-accepting chemotaxis protein [Magnetovibrio sp.]